MNCMKCGKETQGSQVFCDSCLLVMDNYPVKSDTPIQLPSRTQQAPAKKAAHRKHTLPPEEQISILKKATRRLVSTCLILVLLLGLCVSALVYNLTKPQEKVIPTSNKNYTFKQEPGEAY